MNEALATFNQLREDLSDYLFHFTKGENAFETLQKILCEGKLCDMSGNGYICFTETPITMLPEFFKYIHRQYRIPTIIAPYGIGIKKDLLFRAGARPVIYGLPQEKNKFPEEMQWRFVKMDLPNYDYSWLREWRLPKRSLSFKPKHIIVVTFESDERSLFCELKLLGNYDNKNILDDSMIDIKYVYKGISIDEIETYNTKEKFRDYIEEQQEMIDE